MAEILGKLDKFAKFYCSAGVWENSTVSQTGARHVFLGQYEQSGLLFLHTSNRSQGLFGIVCEQCKYGKLWTFHLTNHETFTLAH